MSPPSLRAAGLYSLLLISLPSSAHLPAVYGRGYLLVDEEQVKDPGHCSPASLVKAPVEEPLRNMLDELEAASGPYSSALAEPLADLGRHYRKTGDLNEAARVFNRALHLVRVNEGLNSTVQLVLLEELAETYRRQGNLQALDQVQGRKYRVYQHDPQVDEATVAQATLDYLSWERQAIGAGIASNSMQRLLEAYLLNQRLLGELNTAGLANTPRYRQLAFSQLANLYLIMGIELMETGGTAIVASGSTHSSQSASESFVRRRIGRIQLSGLSDGRDLLETLIEQASPEDAHALAFLHLALGDWHQWNGKTRLADRNYATVVHLLKQRGETALLQEWLGEPRELPDARLFQPFDSNLPHQMSSSFTASFVVSSKGIARDLELTGEKTREASRLARMVSGTHFRPRYVTGEPEESMAEGRRYRLVGPLVAAGQETACIAGLM